MGNSRTEQKVADTLLQSEKTIALGGREYTIAPPTIATLAMVSREIASVPEISITADEETVYKTLNYAKNGKSIARVIAMLIIGAKAIRDEESECKKNVFKRVAKKSTLDTITEHLFFEAQPRELAGAFAIAIDSMQVADFFSLSVSLTKVNILKPTVKTTETTASGQS